MFGMNGIIKIYVADMSMLRFNHNLSLPEFILKIVKFTGELTFVPV